ncbi:het domain-containing [Fusarium sporotrichioides]|uniref:Het domain-containing n=1 Tax=Fusarium sporotrichioides TaxID=5514 RepID=A0A395SNG7_FUSSP|nr:het domain-containing [Fusarium sporotrichioides]
MNEGTVAMNQTENSTNQTQGPGAGNVSGHSLGQPPSLYDRLDPDQDRMRLLQIKEAANDSDPITCVLSQDIFGDRPKFDALSYMWGCDKAEQKITLNGHEFSIRQNLWDALQYLRKHCHRRYYWIDAVCINQSDIDERNKQVRIMHHIYFRAQTVVVWLGKKYSGYEATLPHLRTLGHGNTGDGETTPESTPELSRTDVAVRNLAIDLCNDAYWKRLWIIQEIGLAQEIKVCFGNSAVEWKQFTHFLRMHNLGSDGPVRLERQREERYTGSNTLLHLLSAHREAECQDRKDKVYGLLGMASDARCFDIDYNKSRLEIWTDVMEFMNLNSLFSNEDVIAVGDLVKFLLMGAECDPLQQILRTYAPGNQNEKIITGTNDHRAFQLQGAMLGCVISVGPQPKEIIGKLDVVDKWTQQVQENYRNDLGEAHKESDALIRTILDLDNDSLLTKCFDCRSILQWERLYHRGDKTAEWMMELQSKAHSPDKKDSSPATQVSANNSRLFQMSGQDSTPWKLGLGSSDIRVGDLICWLEFPRRAVVVRAAIVRTASGARRGTFQVVGTAVVAADLKESRLGCSQRRNWSDGNLGLNILMDARTIFVLLAN